MVEVLEEKFKKYLTVLKTNKVLVENLYSSHLKHPITHRYQCCNVPKSDLKYDEQYQYAVTRQTTCDIIPPGISPSAFNPGRNLTEVFQHISISSIKWQYFISSEGVQTEFPAHNFGNSPYSECINRHDTRHRSVYISTVYPNRKNIVIVLDQGNSLSPTQLDTSKAVANHILSTLSANDRVAVIGLSSHVEFPREDGCLSTRLTPLTYEAKLYFKNYIRDLEKQPSATNHSMGFHKAFELLWNTLSPDNKTVVEEDSMILYISRGLLSSLTEAKDVLKMIANENGRMRHKVVINTYAVIDEGKPIMYEKTFMEDVAHQNFTKYLVEQRYPSPVRSGSMVSVSSDRDLSSIVGNFTMSLGWKESKKPMISMPFKDEVGKGVVVALTWPCFYKKKLIGIVGLDLHLGDLVEDVTYFTKDKHAYAFIVDKNGYTIMHPSLSRPILTTTQPMNTDIVHFEKYSGFTNISTRILNDPEGISVLKLDRASEGEVKRIRIKYTWKQVFVNVSMIGVTPYVMVIREESDFETRSFQQEDGGLTQQVYHRLDIVPADNMCMHFKELATMDTSTLFLSANAFNRPFEHLSQEESKRMVQNMFTYLHDKTDLISNSALKEGLRKDVAVLAKINDVWVQLHQYSSLKDYIVRRYIATQSGAMRMYPGTLLNKAYDPTKQAWFTRAMDYPGQITITAPYLDKGGAGYIVTISHTVYQGGQTTPHDTSDPILGVMGLDITHGYFYKILIDMLPVCKKDYMRCFVMDDSGYLIAHRDLIEPNGRSPVEQTHITHKEPLVADDILNHVGFVKKRLCNNYNDRTIQRFYTFNTSLDGVLTNLVHGEHRSIYQVTPIPGTNGFLGIVNQTSKMMQAFCPCSMVDRLCLNCNRMEQTECECPCECPLDLDFCTGQLFKDEDSNPSCPVYPESVEPVQVEAPIINTLHQCAHSRCIERKTQDSCVGVLDCEWCVLEHDAKTNLSMPFCSTQRTCFAGVLGANTPYDDAVPIQAQEITHTFKSTPVGPVAGGIMGCFLVLAFGVYCYRHHVHRNSHSYITAHNENQDHEHMDHEIEDLDSPSDLGTASGHTNIVLASFDNPAAISPYRMNTGYRRNTNAESDLGYSTMTPHEDSEQASTCIEPLIIGRDRYRPSSTVIKPSSNTPMIPPPPSNRRSPTPPKDNLGVKLIPDVTDPSITLDPLRVSDPLQTVLPGQTQLPSQTVLPTDSPHRVIACAQVHMVDIH